MNAVMDIKVVRVYKMPGESFVKAFVDMSINDVLLIKGLRVVDGKEGLFVSLPQQQGKDKKWYNSIKCLSKDLRREINEIVMTAYEGSGRKDLKV